MRRLMTTGRLVRDAWLILGLAILLFGVLEAGAWLVLLGVRWVEESSEPPGDWRARADTYTDPSWVEAYYNEFRRSDALRWRPYVYWRKKPYRGQYINVDSSGLRITPGPASPDQGAGRALKIFMFGGSTLWGTGARDAFTIPAMVASDLRRSGLRVEVSNFGQSGYVSTQSLVALLLELRAGRRPDVVVFYDGINDTFSAFAQQRPGLPQNEKNRTADFNLSQASVARLGRLVLRDVADRSATVQLAKRVLRRSAGGDSLRRPSNPDSLATLVVTTYLSNLEVLRALSEHYHFTPLAYWQPTIFQKPMLTKYEQVERAKVPELARFFEQTYASLAARAHGGAVHDLSRVFSTWRDPVYVDWMHLGETGNALIAQRIAGDVLTTTANLAGTGTAAPVPGAGGTRP